MADGRLGNCGNQTPTNCLIQFVPSIFVWPSCVTRDVLAGRSVVAGCDQASVRKRQQQDEANQGLGERIDWHHGIERN